jgi:hypothetical protein
MFSRLWLINLVLAVGVAFFGLKAYGVWSEEDKRPSEIGPIKKSLPWQGKTVAKLSVPLESGYEVVASKNLFSVERAELKPQEQKEKPGPKSKADERLVKLLELAYKQTNLYGVIMVDNHKEALINEVPAGGRKGVAGDGVKRVKEGDTVGRFKVKKIDKTSVLLTAGGREWRVSLFDKDKPKKRIPIKRATGPVVAGAPSEGRSVRESPVIGKKKIVPEREVAKREIFEKARNRRRTLPIANKSVDGN